MPLAMLAPGRRRVAARPAQVLMQDGERRIVDGGLWQEDAARGLLGLSVLVPGNTVAVAFLLHSARLPQMWRLPFVSELLVVGAEATVLRSGLLVQSAILLAVGALGLWAQTARVQLLSSLADLGDEPAGERKSAQQFTAAALGRMVCCPAVRRPWGALLQLQFVATELTGLGLALVCWFDLFSNLVVHMAFVLFTFNSGMVWLLMDTIFELALARQFPKAPSVNLLLPTQSPAGPVVEELLLPVRIAGRVVDLALGQSRQDRILFWLKLRVCGVGMGVLAFNVMVLAVASALQSPYEVLKVMEQYIKSGVVVEDPQFPLGAISACAACEWALVVVAPALFLMSFWDSFAGCGASLPAAAGPGAAEVVAAHLRGPPTTNGVCMRRPGLVREGLPP